MGDIFKRAEQETLQPMTADKATLTWDGEVSGCTQLSITYSQQITRRRVIGGKEAVIYASQPNGQINIQRMITPRSSTMFGKEGWNSCEKGVVKLALGSSCENKTGGAQTTFRATGAIVSSFSIQLEAESLTVADNVVIDFLQLFQE